MQDSNNQKLPSRVPEKLLSPNGNGGDTPPEKASIRAVDAYVELLYDELPDKIRGSSLLLQLARNPDNLEELARNESVLNALARVLREDWKKSLDLSTNIVYIFFCFSTYTHFHPVIVQHKIGSLCMDVIEYELRRFDQMKAELELRKNGPMTRSGSRSSINKSSMDDSLDLENEERPREMEPPKRRIPELKQRPKSGNWSGSSGSGGGLQGTPGMSASMGSSLLKSRFMTSSYHEFLSNELDAKLSPESPKDFKGGDHLEKIQRQFKVFSKKQEQLLRVAFYLLLNVAENVKLEEKMRRKHIVQMLVRALDRQNVDLLLLVVTFLKKLSIVRDNKDEMLALDAVEKLPRLLQGTGHADLVQGTLKLLFNLSFDGRLRAAMIRAGLLPRLIAFLNDEKHHGTVLKILYHLSLDDSVKSMFTYSADCVALVTDMLLLNLNHKSETDLVALAINLALNRRNAQIMVDNNRLHTLMSRAFKYGDALLMKLIRNVSHHEALRPFFVDFVGDLAKILTMSEDEAFVVECVGILGNLALPDLDYAQLLLNFDLVRWIKNVLAGDAKKDDLVLDTIVFLGTCACDEACAVLICRSELVLAAIELLKAKQEDDEIVLQIVYVFQQVLRHESTRQHIIRETEAPAYLIDLMHDKNPEIRRVCDYCLDIIACTDAEWAGRIKLENFRNHNAQWLNMVETLQEDNQEDYATGLEDADLEFMPSEYLEHCKFYQSQEDEGEEDGEEAGYGMGTAGRKAIRPMSGADFEVESRGGGGAAAGRKEEESAYQNCDMIDNETMLLSS